MVLNLKTSFDSITWRKITKKPLIAVCSHLRESVYAFLSLKVILLISECTFTILA